MVHLQCSVFIPYTWHLANGLAGASRRYRKIMASSVVVVWMVDLRATMLAFSPLVRSLVVVRKPLVPSLLVISPNLAWYNKTHFKRYSVVFSKSNYLLYQDQVILRIICQKLRLVVLKWCYIICLTVVVTRQRPLVVASHQRRNSLKAWWAETLSDRNFNTSYFGPMEDKLKYEVPPVKLKCRTKIGVVLNFNDTGFKDLVTTPQLVLY